GHSVKHSYVGVELNPSSTSGGAQITTVQPSSPAENAGLQSGDVVTAINGKAVASTEQFIETVDNYPPGQTITLQVKRGGATKSVQVQLGTRPQSAQNG
ncbi:MAG: PDZ domain-containing protein, partial [Solirubrobacterales bacterium]|nr:PDZ domain-containing protein [Solirubrobacterales bacterium]